MRTSRTSVPIASRLGRPGPASSAGRLVRSVTDLGPFFVFFAGLVAIQGVHMLEHVIQLLQVTVFGVPEDDALGLLGYALAIQGTEEWLHLAFNGSYLIGLVALVVPLWRRVPSVLPLSAFVTFVVGAVALESWHSAEHAVIIANVIANGGCPCPGILDSRTGLGDTYLHFFYNATVYAAVLVPSGTSPGRLRPPAHDEMTVPRDLLDEIHRELLDSSDKLTRECERLAELIELNRLALAAFCASAAPRPSSTSSTTRITSEARGSPRSCARSAPAPPIGRDASMFPARNVDAAQGGSYRGSPTDSSRGVPLFEFRILGPLEVVRDGVVVPLHRPQPRAALALLLLHANQVVSVDRLVAALWGDDPPQHAANAVQAAISRLRRQLLDGAEAADLIQTRPPGYVIEISDDAVDLARFQRLVERAHGALRVGEAEAGSRLLREALAIWRGPALSDLAREGVLQREAERLEEERLVALELRIGADPPAAATQRSSPSSKRSSPSIPTAKGSERTSCWRSTEPADRQMRSRRISTGAVSSSRSSASSRAERSRSSSVRCSFRIRRSSPSSDSGDRRPEGPVSGCARARFAASRRTRVRARLAPLGVAACRRRQRQRAPRHGAGREWKDAPLRRDRAPRLRGRCGRRLPVSCRLHQRRSPRAARALRNGLATDACRPRRPRRTHVQRVRGSAQTPDECGTAAASRRRRRLDPPRAAARRARSRPVGGGRRAPTARPARPCGRTGDRQPVRGPARRPGRGRRDPRRERRRAAPCARARSPPSGGRRETSTRSGGVGRRPPAERAERDAGRGRQRSRRPAAGARAHPTDQRGFGNREEPVVCPFKGLAPFETDDADYFFGREEPVADLVARLVGAHFLCISGPSGSGKSSLLRAGTARDAGGRRHPGERAVAAGADASRATSSRSARTRPRSRFRRRATPARGRPARGGVHRLLRRGGAGRVRRGASSAQLPSGSREQSSSRFAPTSLVTALRTPISQLSSAMGPFSSAP